MTSYCQHCGVSNLSTHIRCYMCHHLICSSGFQGELLNGCYRIIAELGSGGFSTVYKAIDTQNQQEVAIKEIYLKGLSPEEMIEATYTFNREAELLAQLRHPRLPRLLDRFNDSEYWYLVLNFLQGQTLEAYLWKQAAVGRRGLPMAEVVDIGIQLSQTLHYLHTRYPPVVFRDLKPGNVMRSDQGHITLIDFGIARFYKPEQRKDTIPFGSKGYAAPEQYGRQSTPLSDIYALGVLLYQMVTGLDPVNGITWPPPSPKFGPPVGTGLLESLITEMLEQDMQRRPQSARDVAFRLQDIRNKDWKVTNSVSSPLQPKQPGKRHNVSSSPVPSPANRRIPLITLVGHVNPVRFIAWSPDSKYIASLGESTTKSYADVQVWQVDTGKHRFAFRASCGSYLPLSWSPDSRSLIFVTGGSVYLLRVDTGKSVELNCYRFIGAVAWSSDGESIAVIRDGLWSRNVKVQLWDTDLQRIKSSLAISPAFNKVSLSANNQYVAFITKDRENIEIWDMKTQNKTRTALAYEINEAIEDNSLSPSLLWSPDGKYIACIYYRCAFCFRECSNPSHKLSRNMRVYLVDKGRHVFFKTVLPPNYSSWAPDSKRIALCHMREIQVLDITTGKALLISADFPEGVGPLAWSPDGTCIAVGGYRKVQVWEV